MSGREHPTESLSPYLDGALSNEERREVEGHLRTCDACARLLDDLRTLSRDLRDEVIPEVPPELEGRVRRALDGAGGEVVPFRRRWAIPATVAATLGAVALLVVASRFTTWEAPPPAPVLPSVVEPSVEALEPAPPAPPPAPAPAPARERSEARRETVAAETEAAAPEPPMPAPAPLADRVVPEGRPPTATEKAAALVAGSARAGATQGGMQSMREPPTPTFFAADCHETFEPYDAALRRVTVDPERDRLTIDGFVGSLGGNIVVRDDARLERTYVVPLRRWVELRHFLVSARYDSDAADEPVPPEADCVRVRVEFVPEAR